MGMDQNDFQEISTHLARYCHVVDRGTLDEIVTLFWDNLVAELGMKIE